MVGLQGWLHRWRSHRRGGGGGTPSSRLPPHPSGGPRRPMKRRGRERRSKTAPQCSNSKRRAGLGVVKRGEVGLWAGEREMEIACD